MASRYVVPAFVLALVAGGVGYWVARDTVIDPAVAQAPAAAAPAVPAAASAAPTADNPKVAEVNGEAILKGDVDHLYQVIKQRTGNGAPPEDQVFWMLVDQIASSRLIVQAAQADKLQDTPDVQKAVRMATEQILQEAYVQGQFKGLESDTVLRPLYDKLVDSMKGQEEVRARHILVADEAKANELIKQINAGAKFEDVAKANSTDSGSKEQGGDLGWFSKDTMVAEFANVAFALSKGQMSQTPVKTQFGYHVIQVEDRRPRTAPAFDEVKQQLLSQAQQEKLQATLNMLREKGNIQKFAAAGVPALPQEAPAPAAGQAAPAAAPEAGK